jgi:hypothetical protein
MDPTGVGMTLQRNLSGQHNSNEDPHAFYGCIFKLNDDLLWLGDSLAALRTYDLLRLVDILESDGAFNTADGVDVYTHGRYSVYADMAKFTGGQGKIKQVISDKPLIRYNDFISNRFYERSDIFSVILPGLLAYADLDELRQWG